MEDELTHLRSIVLNLAESPVFHSTEAGESFCGVCHSTRDYAGLIAHEDHCAYLAALAYKAERDEESDRHWSEKAQQADASGAASVVCITGDCQRASMQGSLYCAEHRAEL